jgi:hypothetical protein
MDRHLAHASCSRASTPATSAERSGGTLRVVLPLLEAFRLEDDRHAVMNFGDEFVRFGDHHRARQEVASFSILPSWPQTCERDRLTIPASEIMASEIIRMFAAWRAVRFGG